MRSFPDSTYTMRGQWANRLCPLCRGLFCEAEVEDCRYRNLDKRPLLDGREHCAPLPVSCPAISPSEPPKREPLYRINPDEANLGGYVGFIFGALSFIGTVWAWYFIPETKNRTVDE